MLEICKLMCNWFPRTSSLTKRQWATLVVFGSAYLFAACVTSLQAPFYPAEAQRKGASSTEYGLVFGIFQLVVFIVSPIYGKYMNKFGAKLIFNVGIMTTGIACFIFGFLDDVDGHEAFITLSFLIRIFEAFGSAAFMTAAFTIIAGEFPNSVALTFASLETFYGLGLIIGPSLGGALFQVGGFKAPFMITGLCLAVVAVLTPFCMPNGKSMDGGDCKETEGFGIWSILKVSGASLAALSIWMSSNSIGFLNATLEPHLRQFGFTPLQIGLVFMATGGSYAISAPIWGKLMDKKCHPKYVTLYGSLLLIIAHLIIGPAIFFPGETIFEVTIVGLVIHGIGVGAIQVAGFILALRESIASGFPDNLATYSVVSGLWASSLSLGLFVGPSVGGFLLDLGDYRLASLFPLITATIVLALVIVYLFVDRRNMKKAYRGALESEKLLEGKIPSRRPSIYENSHEFKGHLSFTNYGTGEDIAP